MDMYETLKSRHPGRDRRRGQGRTLKSRSAARRAHQAGGCAGLRATYTYRLAEIQYGRFERILFLPSPINPDKVTAASKNGFWKSGWSSARPIRHTRCPYPLSSDPDEISTPVLHVLWLRK